MHKNICRDNFNHFSRLFLLLTMICLILLGCSTDTVNSDNTREPSDTSQVYTSSELDNDTAGTEQDTSLSDSAADDAEFVTLDSIPAYSDSPYVEINGNEPYFTESEITDTSYEFYSDLDDLGRCGVAIACIGQDLMPTEERGSISSVEPTGWHTVTYDGIDADYLYNRCHLIGWQLTGENANKKNLITGTRYLNVEGMLPFENMVTDYILETDYHVMYRVTPIFEGDNLVASGVLIEALSVEDDGDGICYNVYCYNVQPGITIDYATGDSREDDTVIASGESDNTDNSETDYILNTNTMKFHYPDCPSVDLMSDKNKQEYTGSREDLISQGYSPCKNCNP